MSTIAMSVRFCFFFCLIAYCKFTFTGTETPVNVMAAQEQVLSTRSIGLGSTAQGKTSDADSVKKPLRQSST